MALPPPPPSRRHGPFGEKTFKVALVACAALIVGGFAMLGGSDAIASVGTAFVALGTLGLVTGGPGCSQSAASSAAAPSRATRPEGSE